MLAEHCPDNDVAEISSDQMNACVSVCFMPFLAHRAWRKLEYLGSQTTNILFQDQFQPLLASILD